VILREWMAHPPGPSDLAGTIQRARRTLSRSGAGELLRDFNAGTHALAREQGKLVYGGWIKSFDRLSDRDIAAIQTATIQLDYRPLL
jgi:hypothetical protein